MWAVLHDIGLPSEFWKHLNEFVEKYPCETEPRSVAAACQVFTIVVGTRTFDVVRVPAVPVLVEIDYGDGIVFVFEPEQGHAAVLFRVTKVHGGGAVKEPFILTNIGYTGWRANQMCPQTRYEPSVCWSEPEKCCSVRWLKTRCGKLPVWTPVSPEWSDSLDEVLCDALAISHADNGGEVPPGVCVCSGTHVIICWGLAHGSFRRVVQVNTKFMRPSLLLRANVGTGP